MLLYHGTSAKFLEPILRDGLRPRGTDGGRWQEWPSRPDCVYLTSAYGFYFAMACPTEDGDRLVLEIDTAQLDQTLLLTVKDRCRGILVGLAKTSDAAPAPHPKSTIRGVGGSPPSIARALRVDASPPGPFRSTPS